MERLKRISPLGISLPIEIISRLDEERGDITRSRYILRVLEGIYSVRKSKDKIHNNNCQHSSDCRLEIPRLSESKSHSKLTSPTSQNVLPYEVNKNLCEAAGCNKEATTEIKVNVGELGTINLDLCESCLPNFRSLRQKVTV